MSANNGFWKPTSSTTTTGNTGFREDDNGFNPGFYYSAEAVSIQQQRRLLPITKHKRQILYAVENYKVTVIVGETGCGKSTQLPQYLVQEGGWAGNDFQICVTQPRRIAAITLSQRVGKEMNDTTYTKVGYIVRFDEKPGIQINYVTDGILVQEAIHGDPLLSKYSVIILDEAHERTIQTDVLLGLLRKIRKQRPKLRLIICSATIQAEQFLNFFTDNNENNDGTIISVDGRQYPVDVLYSQNPVPDYVIATVETAWKIHSSQQQDGSSGDILCFLPTAEDIHRAIRIAEEYFEQQEISTNNIRQVEFFPLYGNLPYHMQTRIFHNPGSSSNNRDSARRIIFSTNISETSVTVPRIQFVIDSGLVKLPYFDPNTGLERVIVTTVSQASAQQRAGRAGRIGAGQCYRLYTEDALSKLPAQTPPEIVRTNLSSFILTLKAVGVDNVLAFDMMDLPSIESLKHGLESLYALGAIDDKTNITATGLDMAVFPVEPRVSRMLLESLSEGCSWEVLAVASAMQVRDLLQKPRRQQQIIDYETTLSDIADPSGDHVTYANIFAEMDDNGIDEDTCKDRYINFLAIKRGVEVRNQLARFLRRFGKVKATGLVDGNVRAVAIRRCVTAGFFFNIAKLGNDGRYYTLRKQILVRPISNSVLTLQTAIASEYIIFGESCDGANGGIELRHVSAIEAKWLRDIAPHYWK